MNDDSENTRCTSSSSAIAAIVAALPLLYVLSIGPTVFFFNKYPGMMRSMENAASAFYAPVFWLHRNTALKQPLESYFEWWERLASS